MSQRTNSSSQTPLLRSALVGVAFVALIGCSENNPIEPGPPAFPFAATPDQLIANFEKVHNDMDFAEYDKLLAEDFQFWFAAEDARLAANGMFWDRATDIASTRNMFTGAAGQTPEGSIRPAVQSIELILAPIDEVWRAASSESIGGVTAIPSGAMRREYSVTLEVDYAAGDIVSQVRGGQLFYAVPTTVPDGKGGTTQEWQLLLWRDLGETLKSTTESVSWGGVKALYDVRSETTPLRE
jgi:hypothetical protein